MKNFSNARFARLFAIIVMVAVIGFSMTACGDGGDGGGGFDAYKLIGKWKNDADIYMEFKNPQSTGNKVQMINCMISTSPSEDTYTGGTGGIEGNFFWWYTHSFKMAFEGDKLRISDFVSDLEPPDDNFNGIPNSVINGLYTRQ